MTPSRPLLKYIAIPYYYYFLQRSTPAALSTGYQAPRRPQPATFWFSRPSCVYLRHSSRGAGSWLLLIIFFFLSIYFFLNSLPSSTPFKLIVLSVNKQLFVVYIVFITHLRFINSFENVRMPQTEMQLPSSSSTIFV